MWGIRRMRFATGVDDDLRPFHDALPRRPGDRPRRARRARSCGSAAPPLPWEALVGRDHRAADRVRPRGRDPAAADRARSAARCPRDRAARRPAAGRRRRRSRRRSSPRSTSRRRARSRCAARRPRSPPAASTCSPPTRARLAPAARDPRHRPVDARDARALRPGPLRPRRRPATSATSSSSAGCTTGNPRARADEAEVREFFAPYGEWKGARRRVPALARRPRPAARGRSVLLERVPRVEPLAGQELVRQRLLGASARSRDQVVRRASSRRRRCHSAGSW